MTKDQYLNTEDGPNPPVSTSLTLPTAGEIVPAESKSARSEIENNDLSRPAVLNLRSPSLTGDVIDFAREGLLDQLSVLRKKYGELLGERFFNQQHLDACFNRGYQLDFYNQVRRQGGNFETKFRHRIGILQQREATLNIEIAEIRAKIIEIDPLTVNCGPEGPIVPGNTFPLFLAEAISPQTDLRAFVRDLAIAKYRDLGDADICKKLDVEDLLMVSGRPPIGLPEDWAEKYGVSSFVAAYNHLKCKNLIQKMIWKAKERFGVLP